MNAAQCAVTHRLPAVGLCLRVLAGTVAVDDNAASRQQARARIADMPASSWTAAVFCANGLIALGVPSMSCNRIRVPEDLAIVGDDDIEGAAAAAARLASLRRPHWRYGRAAARLLLEEANDHAREHRQAKLIARESSSPACFATGPSVASGLAGTFARPRPVRIRP